MPKTKNHIQAPILILTPHLSPILLINLKVNQNKIPTKDKDKGIVREFPKQLDANRCFKCQGYGHFQDECLNRRALTIKMIEEVDQIVIKPSEEETEEEQEATILTPEVSEFLVLNRVLHTMESPKEESQRELIFHSRKVCSLIIDGGSCTNVASSHLVDKLKPPIIPQPHPYSLQWLKKGNEVHVTKLALIACNISNFKDEVLCKILLMDACHLLLRRP